MWDTGEWQLLISMWSIGSIVLLVALINGLLLAFGWGQQTNDQRDDRAFILIGGLIIAAFFFLCGSYAFNMAEEGLQLHNTRTALEQEYPTIGVYRLHMGYQRVHFVQRDQRDCQGDIRFTGPNRTSPRIYNVVCTDPPSEYSSGYSSSSGG